MPRISQFAKRRFFKHPSSQWIIKDDDRYVSRNWKLVAEGGRMTHEFASFLKNYIDTLPVSYKLLGFLFGVDGELLEHQYRDHLGSYMSWSQFPHAEEWILFEKNIGPYVDIDEVSFSQGELYIILISQGDKESFGKCHCNHKRYGYQDCYSRPAKAFQTHTA